MVITLDGNLISSHASGFFSPKRATCATCSELPSNTTSWPVFQAAMPSSSTRSTCSEANQTKYILIFKFWALLLHAEIFCSNHQKKYDIPGGGLPSPNLNVKTNEKINIYNQHCRLLTGARRLFYILSIFCIYIYIFNAICAICFY